MSRRRNPYAAQLESLGTVIGLIRDRVRQVHKRDLTALYLHGRPGIAKSTIVRDVLEDSKRPYRMLEGYLTAARLFQLMQENPRATFVLDDADACMSDRQFMPLMLLALGQRSPSGERRVSYRTAKGDEYIQFSGGLIFISNSPPPGGRSGVEGAFAQRIEVLRYDPSDEQMMGLIWDAASRKLPGISPSEAQQLARFLIEECQELGVRPVIRLFSERAVRDFRSWKEGTTNSHWKELIRSSLRQEAMNAENWSRSMSRREKREQRRVLVERLKVDFPRAADRIREFKRVTGASQDAYYRTLRQMEDRAIR